MCLATAAVLASAAGSVVQGAGQAQAASYQAAVARNNAIIAHQNAQHAAGAASANITQAGLKARAQNAAVKVGAAANGLDVNTGSPADVGASQRELGALDTATVANRAAEAVYGYATQETSFDAQSKLDRAEVPFDIAGGLLKGAGSLGSNAGSLGIGGGGAGAGASDIAAGGSSLISGASDIPAPYSWMGGGSSGAGDIDSLMAG